MRRARGVGRGEKASGRRANEQAETLSLSVTLSGPTVWDGVLRSVPLNGHGHWRSAQRLTGFRMVFLEGCEGCQS